MTRTPDFVVGFEAHRVPKSDIAAAKIQVRVPGILVSVDWIGPSKLCSVKFHGTEHIQCADCDGVAGGHIGISFPVDPSFLLTIGFHVGGLEVTPSTVLGHLGVCWWREPGRPR